MMCELGSPADGSEGGATPTGTSSSGGLAEIGEIGTSADDGAVELAGYGAPRPGVALCVCTPIRNRPIHNSVPLGRSETRIRSPFTTTPRPDRSTTHSPAGVCTTPQWYAAMSSAERRILHSGARPTSVTYR